MSSWSDWRRGAWGAALGAVALLGLVGCTGIGPTTVARDRFDYASAISESWKYEMLLNLVKIRYVDPPVFLEVSSIISQYQAGGQLAAGGTWTNPPFVAGSNVSGFVQFADKPTITYQPLSGEKFARSMMTPVQPASVMALVQAEWPVDFIFRICVQSINGVRNRIGGELRGRKADPEFPRLLAAMRRIQASGDIGIRVEQQDKKESVLLVLGQPTDPAVAADLATVRSILGTQPDAREIRLAYGGMNRTAGEVAMLTRSMFEIMAELASYIDVPQKDVAERRVTPTLVENSAEEGSMAALIQIHSGCSLCADAFASVRYRNTYFWIDDRDLASKRMFSILMVLFTLTERGGAAGGAPIVTIPAG
jgi:hypothetical protein